MCIPQHNDGLVCPVSQITLWSYQGFPRPLQSPAHQSRTAPCPPSSPAARRQVATSRLSDSGPTNAVHAQESWTTSLGTFRQSSIIVHPEFVISSNAIGTMLDCRESMHNGMAAATNNAGARDHPNLAVAALVMRHDGQRNRTNHDRSCEIMNQLLHVFALCKNPPTQITNGFVMTTSQHIDHGLPTPSR